MERISKVQNGTLMLDASHLGEFGLCVAVSVGNKKRITDVIWWDTKDEMISDLKKVLLRLESM